MSTRERIVAAMQQVAAEHGKPLKPLDESVPLLETGLDSLCFAILIARLEGEFGVDPFTSSEEIAFPTTVGDLVALYDAAAPLDAAA